MDYKEILQKIDFARKNQNENARSLKNEGTQFLTPLQVETVPFMLWEGFKYTARNLLAIKNSIENHCSSVSETSKHISDMRRHFQLMNYPIIASIFSPEDIRYNLLDALIQKPEHLLSAHYFLSKLNAEGLIDDTTYNECYDVIDNKSQLISSVAWFDTSRAMDIEYCNSIVTGINKKGTDFVSRIQRNYSFTSVKNWKKYSQFAGQDPEKIESILKSCTIQELLCHINEALASGLSLDDAKFLITSAIQDGGSILPIKFFMCAYENMKLVLCDLIDKGNASCSEYSDIGNLKDIQSSPYYLGDFLSEILKEKLAIGACIDSTTHLMIDESGSQSGQLSGSNLPFSKWQFSIMMLFELLHSCKKLRVYMTGYISDIRELDIPVSELKEMSMIELYLIMYEKAKFQDGIYAGASLEFLEGNNLIAKDDIIIILADSGDGDSDAVYPQCNTIRAPKNRVFYINVEKPYGGTNYTISSNKQYCLDVAGYSDYWFEPIKLACGINSGMAKNMDARGASYRGEE